MLEQERDRAPIEAVLGKLCERFGRESFAVVERWDHDVCAVGGAAAAGARLVYISTCGLSEGRYDVSVEDATRAGDDERRAAQDHFVGLDFDALAALVARQLRLREVS